MDDLALLELLECPVCFEKLDATAKVLPCQHTFCKPCLQRILKSQKELRCPECRTLVLGGIEQLPSNLLLIRLLDGVRCGQNASRFGSMQRSGLLSSPACIRRIPRGLQLPPTGPRSHTDGVPRAKALYSYRGHSPGELRFNKGDIIVLLRQLDENWYLGEVNGVSGVFPASSVQVIKQLPLPPPLCRALYNFDLRSRNKSENKDCLSFHKGDIITVISRVDGDWAEGKLGDKVGIFPVLFVEPNTTARQLLQSSGSPWPAPLGCTPLGTASPRARGQELHKAPDTRRKSPRPFSITTALNTLNRMVHAPTDRPALRISSPVLISSSNPSVAAPGSEQDVPRSPPQVSTPYYPAPGPLGHSAAIVTLPHLQHQPATSMCVALHPYTARGPDELELQKGEGVRVVGPCHEGWLRGVSLATGRAGIFPSSYVAPLLRRPSMPNSKLPSLYASWTLSASSLSSQGSGTDSAQRQSRALRAALPVPVPSAGHTSLRRGRACARKTGSLQRPGHPGLPAAGSLRRVPTAVVQPQQLQPPPHSGASQEAAPVLVLRGGESRTPSICSSVILDAKDPPASSEAVPRPPLSAPPSILVKPDTSRSSTDKQVKTVRFQNHSPPPPKRH
ncbi:SH3R2 ligase, partial [Penelope pileata]|nr:SH3R2 ligase [Penelope pileata]